MAHMMTRMTRMTRWLDSHDSLARWLAVCQDPRFTLDKLAICLKVCFNSKRGFHPTVSKEL